MHTSTLPRRVPLAEAAARVPCHPKTLRRMIARGELAGYRLGSRRILIDLDDLEAALRPIPTRRPS